MHRFFQQVLPLLESKDGRLTMCTVSGKEQTFGKLEGNKQRKQVRVKKAFYLNSQKQTYIPILL